MRRAERREREGEWGDGGQAAQSNEPRQKKATDAGPRNDLGACLFMLRTYQRRGCVARSTVQRLDLVQTNTAAPNTRIYPWGCAALCCPLPVRVRCRIQSVPVCLTRNTTLAPTHDASIQEQAGFGVLDHPLEPLAQVHSRHGTARHDVPLVCLDGIQLQTLCAVSTIGLPTTLNSFLSPKPNAPRGSRPRSWTRRRRFCS